MAGLIHQLKSDLNDAKREREYWRQRYDDSINFVIPTRKPIINDRPEKTDMVNDIRADSTATLACRAAADGLASFTISQNFPWFQLSNNQEALNKNKAVKSYQDAVEEVLYSFFYRSTLYKIIPQLYTDAHALGTATMFTQMVDGIGHFIAINPLEVYIKEDFHGKICVHWRIFRARRSQINKEFPQAANMFPDLKVNDSMAYNDQEMTLVHCVFKRGEYVCDPELYGEAVDPSYYDNEMSGESKDYIGVYFFESKDKPLRIEGYYERPYITWRMIKNTNETYGSCPAFEAMPEILIINQAGKAYAAIVQQEAYPALLAVGIGKDQFRRNPNSTTFSDFGATVSRMVPPGDSQLTLQMIQIYTDRIMRAFRADLYQILEQDSQQRTAFEVAERRGEKLSMLSAVSSQLNDELITPLIERALGMCERAGLLPELPEGWKDSIKIEPRGPLYQEQRRYHKTGTILNALTAAAPVFQMMPTSADIFDADKAVQEIFDASDAPAVIYRDEDEVAALRKAREEANARAQAAAAIGTLSDAYQKTSKAPVPGSPAEILSQQMAGGL